MVKPVKKSGAAGGRQDRLASLINKLQNTDFGGGGKGFFAPKTGKNTIRILPPVGEMQFFFQQVGVHNFPPDGKKRVYCPSFTSDGDLPCPVCEIVDQLYKAGDSASKKLAGQLRHKKKFWMNVIDRSNESAGPLIFTPGVQVFEPIAILIQDPEYGEIYDPEDGLDIVVEKKGSGIDTEYQVMPKRNGSVLGDVHQVDEWLQAAIDLSFVEVSDDPSEDKKLSEGHGLYLLPYDRIVTEYGLDNFDSEDFSKEEDDEDEEPVRNRKSATASQKSSRPVAKRRVEDDDDDENDDDDEEDDPPPAKSGRRVVRRSGR